MNKEIYGILEKIKYYAENMLTVLENGQENTVEFGSRVAGLTQLMDAMPTVVPDVLYEEYHEFFCNFNIFCKECTDEEYLVDNVDKMAEFLLYFVECMDNLLKKYERRSKKCVCCGEEVVYLPLPSYYDEMKQKYGVSDNRRAETLNREEYLCPKCLASDRDRLIVSFLRRIGLADNSRREKLLQIAPARTIEHWLHANCPALTYHSTDLFMKGVTFTSDIQDMSMVADQSYDYFICSHVLEHVQDDRKAMRELYRILKHDGMGIFLVPISLDAKGIDEEWGLSEEENWRRFGQGDYCRAYDKSEMVGRLQEAGFIVHELGKEFFGPEIFENCGLTDTATLYVLVKQQGEMEELIGQKLEQWKKVSAEYPLVSVILPTYNHEDYVEEAIESVLKQTYPNIEFLVADDGSSDGTPQKVLQYEEKIDQIHLFEENSGGKITQFLRERTKGKYIAMMHSDDVWEPDKIEMQVAYMESHPECGACFTGCECIDEEGNSLGNKYFLVTNKKRDEWLRHFYEHGNCLAHPSILIHRDLYINLYIENAARMFWQLPDYWLWVNLVQKKEIHIIEKTLVYFREHNTDKSKNTSAPSAENSMRHIVEETYIWYQTFKRMDDNLFLSAFADMLIKKDACTEREVMCEKMFVMLQPRTKWLEQAAVFYMYDICQNPGMLEFMEKEYSFTRKEIAKISGNLWN